MSLFTLYIVNKSGGLIFNRDLSPAAAKMGGNEYLMAASTFHSLHAISKQLAPVKSGGIVTVEAPTFVLHCFESPTGVKFFVTAKPKTPDVAVFLRRVYEMYADFVLKVGERQIGWTYRMWRCVTTTSISPAAASRRTPFTNWRCPSA